MIPLLASLPITPDFTFDSDYNVVNGAPARGEPAIWRANINSVIYAIVSRMPGLREGRSILVLTSHSSPGTIAAADYLIRPETAKDLADRLGGSDPRHFQLVLRVFVDKNATVKTEYVAHHVLVR